MAEMPVDKQPSVTITIQKEYSYFSGVNLSFLTHWNQPDRPRCINLHPSHRLELQHCELIIDPALRGGQGGAGGGAGEASSSSVGQRAARARVDPGAAAGGRAPETLWSTSTWKHLSVRSPAPRGEPGRVDTEAVIRDSLHIDRALSQTHNTVYLHGSPRLLQ